MNTSKEIKYYYPEVTDANPVSEVKAKVIDLLNYCKSASEKKDIVIDQKLNITQRGYGKQIANQGNIQINIMDQEVLIGLINIVEMLSGVENRITQMISGIQAETENMHASHIEFKPGMNLRQYQEEIAKAIVIHDYKVNGGTPSDVAERLGISKSTAIKYVREAYGESAIPRPGWPPGPRKRKALNGTKNVQKLIGNV